MPPGLFRALQILLIMPGINGAVEFIGPCRTGTLALPSVKEEMAPGLGQLETSASDPWLPSSEKINGKELGPAHHTIPFFGQRKPARIREIGIK